MGNFLALCIASEMQSREPPLKDNNKVLKIIKIDGNILELRTPILVRDLLVNHPNCFVGIFKEATQPLPLDYKLKIGKNYYLLPSIDERKVDNEAKRIKVVITKEQLRQLLSKQGRVEELLLGVVPKRVSIGFSKLESIPEGSEVVC